MSINNDIVRIIKVDKLEGTFYFPQRKVWKFKLLILYLVLKSLFPILTNSL